MSTKCRVKGTILKNVLCGHSCNYIYSICNELDNKFLLGVLNSKVVNYYFKYFNQTNNVPIGEIKGIPFPSSRKEDRLKIIELVDEIYNARISSNKSDSLPHVRTNRCRNKNNRTKHLKTTIACGNAGYCCLY